ncbi:hypothetical protein CPB84DRAFT_1812255 [Gymnopilus junonius]|uniref:Signal recognition particle receptor subunit beta n=1 Tax=Gymnopilus junonius TaxID=109634 RepID=A0A9P5TUU1_GYMJU|nr:hypothetical protein CPB84DRAFT_1812255 [Gymnopilus junonius]
MDDEIPPEKTPEILPLSALFTPQSLIAGSLLVALLFVFALFLLNKRRSKTKGNTSFLSTAILSQLVYGQSLPTQASMQTNSGVATLSSKRSIRVVDVPGHARLRDQFQEYMPETKAIGFVVDANNVSRNAPAVAEHLHHILHVLTSLPPSQHPPSLIILAHKADLFKTSSSSGTSPTTLAVNRVKAILERELEKRRASQSGGVNVEGLGEEGERTDLGGLECGEKEGSTFKFGDWEGGEITFIGTSIVSNSSSGEKGAPTNLEPLWQCLEEFM